MIGLPRAGCPSISGPPIFYVWAIAFGYSAISALAIQLVVLPYLLPAWHAGNGLLVGGDWIAFHNYAVGRAGRIRAEGWSAFELRPFWNAPIGIASAIYALTWPKPWTLIPMNAALHATAAALLFRLLRGFVADWRWAAAESPVRLLPVGAGVGLADPQGRVLHHGIPLLVRGVGGAGSARPGNLAVARARAGPRAAASGIRADLAGAARPDRCGARDRRPGPRGTRLPDRRMDLAKSPPLGAGRRRSGALRAHDPRRRVAPQRPGARLGQGREERAPAGRQARYEGVEPIFTTSGLGANWNYLSREGGRSPGTKAPGCPPAWIGPSTGSP